MDITLNCPNFKHLFKIISRSVLFLHPQRFNVQIKNGPVPFNIQIFIRSCSCFYVFYYIYKIYLYILQRRSYTYIQWNITQPQKRMK